MASTRLTKTFSSSGNRNKWTISLWVKRGKLGSTQTLFACHQNSNYKTRLEIAADDELYFNDEYNGNTNGRIVSNAKLRDTNAWYHIVGIWDKDNSTSGDKIRFYINGSRITSFSDTGNAPSNASTLNVDGQVHEFGSENSGNLFDGAMSHIHFCDGYAYEPTEFGETDSTTGEWKIKTSPSVSYGTNGFFILKDGNGVTDQSPNSNDWTVSAGTLTKTEDCPSNLFCTLNPQGLEQWTLSNGNLSISGSSDNQMVVGTMHSDAGYYEVKMTGTSHGSGGKGARIGLCKVDGSHPITYTGISGNSGDLEKFIGVQTANGNYKAIYNNGYEVTNYSSDSWSQNDILQVAWKNNKIWYGVNGTWLGSGNPSGGTNEADTLTSGSMYLPAIISSLAGADDCHFNFGNGYFGTTAISSEGTNASGIGKFEYDVPTGCTAVSTKGLNE